MKMNPRASLVFNSPNKQHPKKVEGTQTAKRKVPLSKVKEYSMFNKSKPRDINMTPVFKSKTGISRLEEECNIAVPKSLQVFKKLRPQARRDSPMPWEST